MATKLPIQNVDMTPELEQAVAVWHKAQAEATAAATAENEARMKVFRHFFPEGDPRCSKAGRDKFQMPGGFVLEIERRINVSIDRAALPSVAATVAELPPDPETGEVATIENAIKFKPEFSESGYKATRPDVQAILNECLTFKPGTPGMKLEAPKAAKPTAKAGHNPFE